MSVGLGNQEAEVVLNVSVAISTSIDKFKCRNPAFPALANSGNPPSPVQIGDTVCVMRQSEYCWVLFIFCGLIM